MKRNSFVFVVCAAAVLSICVGCSSSLEQEKRGSRMEPRISTITLGVSDLGRSCEFYKKLGLPTEMTPDAGIVLFMTTGTRLSLYPYDKLGEDVGVEVSMEDMGKSTFAGITLAHTVRSKGEVEELLQLAEKAGGKIVKKAQDVFWGGYSGYFSDPDGYLWEVNYSDAFKFGEDGSISF